ncbi:hypothetical protein HDE_02063 [Halotydeus destructor]|nr:hypothetical protein HDE_02063 [Halotydeus destructor]
MFILVSHTNCDSDPLPCLRKLNPVCGNNVDKLDCCAATRYMTCIESKMAAGGCHPNVTQAVMASLTEVKEYACGPTIKKVKGTCSPCNETPMLIVIASIMVGVILISIVIYLCH